LGKKPTVHSNEYIFTDAGPRSPADVAVVTD